MTSVEINKSRQSLFPKEISLDAVDSEANLNFNHVSSSSNLNSPHECLLNPKSSLISYALQAERDVMFRGFLNMGGAVGYLVGSAGWIGGFAVVGTWIFAFADFFYVITSVLWSLDAIDRCNQTVRKSHLTKDEMAIRYAMKRMELLAAFNQAAGGLLFTVGCSLSFYEKRELEAAFFWLFGSVFFTCQAAMVQIMFGMWWDPTMPILPGKWRRWDGGQMLKHCVPTALFNTIGSSLFVVGSFCVFYTSGTLSGWFYTIGSMFFVIAAWADILGVLDSADEKRRVRLLTEGFNELGKA